MAAQEYKPLLGTVEYLAWLEAKAKEADSREDWDESKNYWAAYYAERAKQK